MIMGFAEMSLGNDYGFCLWLYLPGLWIHNQDYEY